MDNKRQSNRQKHHIDFADAVEVFYDDLACTMAEPRPPRRPTLRHGRARRFLACVGVRIISARQATAAEHRQYEQGWIMRDEYDFTGSKRGAVAKTAKERITIRLHLDIIEWFRSQVKGGGNYQTLINDALRKHIERQSGADLESTLRRVLRLELSATNP
jgi:uncharacterized DUF497 family protein